MKEKNTALLGKMYFQKILNSSMPPTFKDVSGIKLGKWSSFWLKSSKIQMG